MDIFLFIGGWSAVTWQMATMWALVAVILHLAIGKKFQPVFLVPLAIGVLLANLPVEGLLNPPQNGNAGGFFYYLSLGAEYQIFQMLIFLLIGMTLDLDYIISYPRMLFLGAAAQIGAFSAFGIAILLGLSGPESASASIISAADALLAIFISYRLADHLVGVITLAVFSAIALAPLIQPIVLGLITTKNERGIRMSEMGKVSPFQKIVFSVLVLFVCSIMIPASIPILGVMLLGNILRESGVLGIGEKHLSFQLKDIVIVILGLSVGITLDGERFFESMTLYIFLMTIFTLVVSTASAVIMAKILNLFTTKNKINPLVAAASIYAGGSYTVDVVQSEGRKADPENILFGPAMSANTAGIIAGIILISYYISCFG